MSPHNFSDSTISCTKLCTRTNSLFQAYVLTVTVNASSVTTAHCSCYCNLLLPRNTFTYASILMLAIVPFKRYQMKFYLSFHKIVLQVVLCTSLIHRWSEPFTGYPDQPSCSSIGFLLSCWTFGFPLSCWTFGPFLSCWTYGLLLSSSSPTNNHFFFLCYISMIC